MKKLLITTMAAASLAFCAKADFPENGTSFEYADEELKAGDSFLEKGVTSDASGNQVETGGYKPKDGWSTEASTDDGLFTITNVSDVTFLSRPKMWDGKVNTKALAIDTSSPLKRGAILSGEAQDVSTTPIFFDSVVQFTATDVAGEPAEEDKLRVWLYESSEEVAQENPDETSSVKKLVVTAAYNDNGTYVKKDYYTDAQIEPDSWHRLTIKSFSNGGFVTFSVWVDKTLVSAEGVTEFLSLQYTHNQGGTSIQGVAFDGKGAIDDIVFTTTDPFYVAPETPKEFLLNLALSADEAAEATLLEVLADGGDLGNGGSYKLNLGTENVIAWVACADGYKVSNNGATYDEGGYWIVPINVADATENGTVNVTITIEEVGGGSGEEPTTSTVEPGKPVECDSEEAAKKVTITVTDADAAAAGQADVIKAVVKQNGNKWVVTAEIDTEATGYIPADTTLVEVAQKLTEIANATEDQDGNVTVALKDVTPGLYYSVDVSENLAGENQGFAPGTRTLATANGSVTLKVSKPKGNSAFFKVVQHLTKE